jgi:lysophospholipase L1-like esterase
MAGESRLRPNDVVAICGDSITRQSVYSCFLETYLLACQPNRPIRTVQCGWGGMTATGFVTRMETGAQTFSPTVATTCFGMNDGRYNHLTEKVAETYRKSLAEIIDRFQRAGTREVIIGGPGCVDTFTFRNPKSKISAEEYNRTLGQLSDIARKVAAEKGVGFADVHGTLAPLMKRAKAALGAAYPVTGPTDGVHAGPNGHLAMAYAFLKAMGCNGDIATLSLDVASGKATASEGHRIVRASRSELEVESGRYPFCFTRGGGSRRDSVTSILPFLPFNDDLNRFVFRVDGLETASARVTWGTESKEFSAEQLKKGINLAAEFLENPFCNAFRQLDNAVTSQQQFEIFYIKEFLGQNRPTLAKAIPETMPALDRAGRSLREVGDRLAEYTAGKVIPVTHLLRVEPLSTLK